MSTVTDSRTERLEAQLAALPAQPGVYLFRDADDAVLYVGKAKSLRARVRSYFRGGDARQGLDRMLARVERIEVVVTQSEGEALHLEQSLIKRHRPPFNVRLRDDKSYPYIAVTVGDEYPRVMFTRERHRRGVVYFGPYSSARRCARRSTSSTAPSASGPARGRNRGGIGHPVPRLPHRPLPGALRRLRLAGRVPRDRSTASSSSSRARRVRSSRSWSADARGRRAAGVRGGGPPAEPAQRRPPSRRAPGRGPARAIGTVDVIGLAVSGDVAAVQVFPLRGGRMVDRHGSDLENVAGEDLAGARSRRSAWSTTGPRPSIPPLIVVPPEPETSPRSRSSSRTRRGSRVEVRAAQRGEKRRLQELAQQNAELALEQRSDRGASGRGFAAIEALEELREALNLESLPIRIECFDISNIQDESPVGSMVVFQDAVPKKAHYRKFGIRHEGGQDDFAMMARGRVAAVRAGAPRRAGRDYDEGFAAMPEPRRHRRRQGAALGGAGARCRSSIFRASR